MALRRSLVLPALVTLVACGGSADEDFDGGGSGDASFAVGNDFDESQLPSDFPRNVIPPDYDNGTFAVLGPVATASFESSVSVAETIEHYTGLLGEPRVDSASADGQRSAQWDGTPWMLSVIGSASESIVGVSKVSN